MMEAAAAVSLHHHHGALPLHASLPPPHHHRSSLPIPVIPQQTTTRRPPCVCSSSSKPPAACLTQTEPTARSAHAVRPTAALHSSRAATGYAAALADACARAGTLRRASSNARAFFFRRHSLPLPQEEDDVDPRVAALVKMLVRKGKAEMVAEVMAEFAAICDKLLPRPAPRAQYHHAY